MANNRFSNKERMIRRLAALPVQIKSEVKDQLRANGRLLLTAQKGFVPVVHGDLIASGETHPNDKPNKLSQVVSFGKGLPAGYALRVEYGTPATEKTPEHHAHPFFWPVYRAFRKRLKSAMSRAAGRGARKAVAAP